MSEYTPGPWGLSLVGNRSKHFCPHKDGESILTVCIDDGVEFAAVWKLEDANLIAAAPELLEALESAYMAMEYMGDSINDLDVFEEEDVEIVNQAFRVARAAIAKARGADE